MGNPKKLWEYLKNLGYSDKSKTKGKIVLDINGQLCFDTLLVCNYINGFFTNVASTLVSTLPSPLNKFSTESVTFQQFYLDKGVTPNEFDLEQISNEFMLKTLSNLNAHKGAGLDRLAPKFLKDGAPNLPLLSPRPSRTTWSVPKLFLCTKRRVDWKWVITDQWAS